MKYRLSLLLVLGVGLLEGCTPPPVIRPADLQMVGDSRLGFLQIGETPRETVLLKLGLPTARFEDDRILLYQVLPNENGDFSVLTPTNAASFPPSLPYEHRNELRVWTKGVYSLVLVFGDDNVLIRMALVGSE